MPKNAEKPYPRRHDWDALRAFAMLLGIALHGALSFFPMFWPIQDSRQNEILGLFVSAIHGFRMPVFFVMSGFFTAMLWRRRGLRALLHHRYRRIFLPLLLGLLTVVPAVEWVSRKALDPGPSKTQTADSQGAASPSAAEGVAEGAKSDPTEPLEISGQDPESGLTPLSVAVATNSLDSVRLLIDKGAEVDGLNRDGSAPIILAALLGHAEAAGLLIEAGADVNIRGSDGSSPLHTAAFFGRSEVAEMLIEAGSDLSIKNGYGQTPVEVLAADWQTTVFIAQMVRVEIDKEQVESGRAEILVLMTEADEAVAEMADSPSKSWLTRLLYQPFFHHLWFLWFLCWLVPAFAIYAGLMDRLGRSESSGGFVLSPFRLLWWVPITLLPQWFMGRQAPVFGADTSAGFLPLPHVLVFYGLFFFFGALYFDARDDQGQVGRRWLLHLSLGLFILFPIGLGLTFSGAGQAEPATRLLTCLFQAAYPWVMTFGLMGLFRRVLTRERPALRYLSDASYWLYLAHLPLIMAAQLMVRDLSMPALVKFALVCLSVTGLLLGVYQWAVRYTWLGTLLNGPRRRPGQASAEIAGSLKGASQSRVT